MIETSRPIRRTAGRSATANVVTQRLTLRWDVLLNHQDRPRLAARWTE